MGDEHDGLQAVCAALADLAGLAAELSAPSPTQPPPGTPGAGMAGGVPGQPDAFARYASWPGYGPPEPYCPSFMGRPLDPYAGPTGHPTAFGPGSYADRPGVDRGDLPEWQRRAVNAFNGLPTPGAPPVGYGHDAECGQCGLAFYRPEGAIDFACPRCGAYSSTEYAGPPPVGYDGWETPGRVGHAFPDARGPARVTAGGSFGHGHTGRVTGTPRPAGPARPEPRRRGLGVGHTIGEMGSDLLESVGFSRYDGDEGPTGWNSQLAMLRPPPHRPYDYNAGRSRGPGQDAPVGYAPPARTPGFGGMVGTGPVRREPVGTTGHATTSGGQFWPAAPGASVGGHTRPTGERRPPHTPRDVGLGHVIGEMGSDLLESVGFSRTGYADDGSRWRGAAYDGPVTYDSVYYDQPSEHVSPEKARQILRDGEANGHPLTEAQRRMFGAAAGRGS